MDSPDINDEVIADSEGEEVSQVSAFTLPGQLRGNSSISAFTAGLNQVSEVENFLGTASIADRAKTRQRIPKSSIQNSFTKMASSTDPLEKRKTSANISSDIIDLSSDDDELNLRPSKPKPKANPKPKLKAKDKPRNTINDKILDVPGTTETNTDNATHAISDSRPRPRPRPLVKRSKPAQENPPPLPSDIPGLLSSPSASISHGPELPIATSPVRPDFHTSQLPPSDPPLPTLTTIHDENDIPPIETLPNHDFDGPLSSPSSLFSDFGEPTKKRKRAAFNLEIDELASDVDLGPGKVQTGAGVAPQVPPHMLPPPPTFFAGSSSSSVGGGDRRPSPQVPSELARDVVDLTMLPPTVQPIFTTATKKATKKAKISRQKKDDATRMDVDEPDDDFDPAESIKKGKPKPKPKAKKGGDTKAKKGKGRAQVEDSIVSKPRAVIESNLEDEDDEGERDQQAIGTSSKKSKQGKNNGNVEGDTKAKKGKGRAQVEDSIVSKPRAVIESNLEDEVDEGEKDQQAIGTSSKKSKQGKNNGNHVEDQQPAPEAEIAKENVMKSTPKVSKKDESNDPALFPSLHSRYEIAPRRSSLPMSELIRRSNSALGSPFSTPQPRTSSSSSATRPIKSGTPTTYSPYLKSSRSVLSRIAPLHPNRRAPPPPLPPPPPKKKTKKELEMEEKWEEEMIDSVGGISEWTCLTDDEKKEMRRAKRAREMGDWDD